MQKLPRTPAQVAASRANGAKSKGPQKPASKSKADHRVTHGFRANFAALAVENRTAYNQHLDAYILRYTPTDKVEQDLVGLLALNMWQMMRLNSVEVALFDLEMKDLEDDIRREYADMDEWGRIALAFKKSAGENALELLRRYKSTAERAYHRAFQALEQILKDRSAASAKPAPQEEKSAAKTQEAAESTGKSRKETQRLNPEAQQPEPISISIHPSFQPTPPASPGLETKMDNLK